MVDFWEKGRDQPSIQAIFAYYFPNFAFMLVRLFYTVVLLGSFHPVFSQNFRVQAAAFADSVGRSYFTDRGVEQVQVKKTATGIYQYLIGAYGTRLEAEAICTQLVDKGFSNPVVIDLEVEQALSITNCGYTSGRIAPSQASEGKNPVRMFFFPANQATLDAEAKVELDRFGLQMQANKALQLRIMGFTDSNGSAESNMVLAGNRAKAARNYLINKGIQADRLFLEVYGESEPLYENKDHQGKVIPENQRWNNRVMLKYKE